MDSSRVRALDAAIELLGTSGLRALTHARVDQRAGLPKGSSSNYFRTRAALLSGVADRIVAREIPPVAAAAPATADELIELLGGLVEHVSGPDRTLTTARLVLFMEASHNPELRDAVSAGRVAMEGSVHRILDGLGALDPVNAAQSLMACAEGLILHRIVRNDQSDPRPAFALVVRGALG
ncbi:TetR/AcrR family transcriptional regulator [Arthrobacter sp. 260]|uniref:TetR/AcrR family transcriptional regulator n=1 Tax=Arthrobacter sp. 260 TaxID=2735314 RepID=UPI0014908EA6|nr:TetR/AcrR family transcriptional regulator [Arthrobacter sp. 260]NOJ59947.1 TetR family transcriptional regulator [Arthrobacter sp. 260]